MPDQILARVRRDATWRLRAVKGTPPSARVRLGRIGADPITMDDAVASIVERATRGLGGYVVTPNVDHIVIGESDDELVDAYRGAWLSVADGMPLLWMAKILGERLPERVSGSDLAMPLLRAAAAADVGVYFLGATISVCRRAARAAETACPGLRIVGFDDPRFERDGDASAIEASFDQALAAGAQLIIVAMGCPKQEVLMHRWQDRYAPAVAIGLGGTLSFLAGEVARCPPWVARSGFEWLYRLLREPRRLAHRYLVRDRAIVGIFGRQWRAGRHDG